MKRFDDIGHFYKKKKEEEGSFVQASSSNNSIGRSVGVCEISRMEVTMRIEREMK